MKIQIRGRNVELTEVLRTRVERRLGFALGRFGERIGRVLLRFSDTNGHRGDVDKRCQIDVGLRPRNVRVEHIDTDLLVALDCAADRASRSVARALERERTCGATKTEKREVREVTPTKSKHKVESRTESRRGSDTTTDQKSVVDESHKRPNGMTETETTTTTKHKVESKTKEKDDSDTTTNEKTVESGSKKRADGLTETQITTTTKHSAPHTKTQKSTTKERRLENSEGKILEHEKTTR